MALGASYVQYPETKHVSSTPFWTHSRQNPIARTEPLPEADEERIDDAVAAAVRSGPGSEPSSRYVGKNSHQPVQWLEQSPS